MKRIISLLMSIVMILSLITVSPITVAASEYWIDIDEIEAAAEKHNISKSSNAYSALLTMNTLYGTQLTNSQKSGVVVFLFEGVGNSSSSDKRMNAMCVLVKNKKIKYVNRNSSTIPDCPFDPSMNKGTDMPTLKSGIYSFTTVNHPSSSGDYAALKVSSGKVLRFKNKKDYYSSTSTGINVHRRSVDYIIKSGSPNSAGCLLIGKSGKSSTDEYAPFIQAVGIVASNDKGNIKYKHSVTGKIVVDRSYASNYLTNIGYPSGAIDILCPVKVPTAPTITSSVAKSSTSIEIKWNAVSGATKYRVDRRSSDESDYTTLTSTSTKTSYTDTGLQANSKYYYRVYAINSAGTSPRSLTYQAYTMTKTPTQPDVSRDSESQLTISWDKVSGAEAYKVLYRKANGNTEYSVLANNLTSTSYAHKNLPAGTKYCYRVVAINKGEVGPEGDRKQVSIDSEQSPTKSKFTKLARPSYNINNDNINQVNLEWKAAVGDSTYKYEIWRDGAKIATTSSLKYTDTSATSGKIHTYQIKVIDTNDNNNNITSSDAFYAASKIEPAVTVTPQSSTSMKISWNKPSGASNLSYSIMRQVNGGTSVEIKTVKDTYYVDTGLTTGATYGYYVKVLDSEGNYLTSIRGKDAVMQILPTSVALNKTSSTLKVGETLSLTATIIPSNSTSKALTWTSSNTSVATVSNGTITAKGEGNTTITVKTANGKIATCTIAVTPAGCTHTFGNWVTATEASCEQNGEQYRICTKCNDENEKETRIIPASGHSYSEEWTVITESTCSQEGSKAHLCTSCGAKTNITSIDVKEHNFGDWISDAEHSCTESGSEYRECSICHTTETQATEPKEHSYELTGETETTPDGPGSRTYTCGVCSHSFTEEYVPEINEGIISIENTAPKAGETITVPVSISENPGIAGFEFALEYDKNVLTPIDIKKGDILKSGTLETNLTEGIPVEELESVTISWFDSYNITANGTLLYITFEVDSQAALGEYIVSLNYEKGNITNEEFSDVMPDILSGRMTIADVIKGDVNLDRKVNSHDIIMLSKYLAKWQSFRNEIDNNENMWNAANVFKDTKLNAKDGTRLAQILAGYEIVEETETVKLASVDYTSDIMLLSVVSETNAIANVENIISVESVEASAGEYIYVPVTLTGNAGIAGFDISIDYDNTTLTPISVTKGDLLINGSFTTNIDGAEDVSSLENLSVHWSDADNIYEDGTLFILEFLVSNNVQVGQVSPIQLTCEEIFDYALTDIEPVVEQGAVNVIECSEEIIEPDIWLYYINDTYMELTDGTACDSIPVNGDFYLNVDIESSSTEFVSATLFVAAYDEFGRMLSLKPQIITEEILNVGTCEIHIDKTSSEIDYLKIFIWDSVSSIKPVSEAVTVFDTTE